MIPHSVYDLDHVDPIELVAEYSNDETMSVDLIATRMALLGIFRKSDTDGGGTLSSEEFQVTPLVPVAILYTPSSSPCFDLSCHVLFALLCLVLSCLALAYLVLSGFSSIC